MKTQKWTQEYYQSIVDWMNSNNKTLKQAKEHFKFGSNSWYASKAKWGGLKPKRVYTKKPAFIDLETTMPTTDSDQVAVIIVPTSKLKSVIGALWQ